MRGKGVHSHRSGDAVARKTWFIFFAGASRPVVADWAEAFEDEAKRIAIAKADANQFTLRALVSTASILIGTALGLWGSAVTHLETGRRATTAAPPEVSAAPHPTCEPTASVYMVSPAEEEV